MSRQSTILKRIKEAVDAVASDSDVYLYGSRARKSAKKSSDWDILILLNTRSVSFDFEKRIIDALYEIEIETGEVISPLIYAKKEWNINYSVTPLFENIHRDGVLI